MAGLQHLNSLFSQAIDNQTSTGVSYIPDLHATGFTINVDGTDFLGIEGSTYLNPGELGFDNDLVDSIVDTEAVGFVAQIQPGDDTLFKGVVGNNYNNPGINSGIFYVNDYEEGPTPNFINFTKNRQEKDPTEYSGAEGDSFNHPDPDEQSQEESNQWLDIFEHKFTPNRKHLDPTEFKGASGTSYSNPGEFVGLHYYEAYNDEGLGTDFFENIHANGFTKLRKHKDPSEFLMVDGDNINTGNDNADNGTLFRQFGGNVFTFGGTQNNKYLPAPGNTFVKKNKIDEDDVALIQQEGKRSVLIQGSEVKNITLEDIYKKHIDDLIDFDQVKGKTDGRLDMRYDNGRVNVNSFLPLQFSRNGITHEPYVVRGIGDTKNIVTQALDDAERIGKYILSPDGVKFIAAQNAIGLLAYKYHRDVISGTDGRYRQSDVDAVGRQQFQYLYNPLSLFSSSIPFIKVRMNRSALLDEGKYTERDKDFSLFGLTVGANENAKIKGLTNKQETDEGITTLGGSIVNNVNTSIDGNPINTQGISGDNYTLAPIDERDNIIADSDWRGNIDGLESIDDGYPFYFKDLRNDKLLIFRGYIQDISENISPSYSSEQYVGRSEPVFAYQSTTRNINFSLQLYPHTEGEFEKIYQKLDYLTGMCYPEYFNDATTDTFTLTRPKPPLCRMRLADLYGSNSKKALGDNPELKHGLLGYINSLSINYQEAGGWNNFNENERAPKHIIANIGFQVIHDQTPNINTRFYGLNYDKVGV